MAERYRTRKFTPRPSKIETPKERGDALRNWLDVHKISISAFCRAASLPRSTLNGYLYGQSDLLTAEQETIEAILGTMDVSDSEAWEILGIPPEGQERFKTFRPPPLGHGLPAPAAEFRNRTLTTPMLGDMPAPLGAVLVIEPGGSQRKYQVFELEDGRLYSATAEMIPSIKGTLLGGLVSIQLP